MSSRKNLLLWLIPVITMVLMLCFLNGIIDRTINTDDASELVLAKLLRDEGSILSKDWYYSTEIRLLNTNLVYSLLFRLTGDWHTVRIASYAVMYSLLLLTVFLYSWKGKNSGVSAPILAALLMLPTSEAYYVIVLRGGFYLPHITIPFLIIALGEWALHTDKARTRGLLTAAGFATALLSGMGGPRQLLTLYIPMLISAGWIYLRCDRKKRDGLAFAGAVFLGGAAGYLVNALILSKIYSFHQWTIGFSFPTISRIDELLKGFLAVFGYRSGAVSAGNILANLLCTGWIGLSATAAIYALRRRKEVPAGYVRIAALTCSALAVFILLYLFTDMYFTDQYYLPVTMLTIPLLICFFQHVQWKKAVTGTILAVFMAGMFLSAGLFVGSAGREDPNARKREAAEFLVENGYEQGYATFWNANIITELTNGKVEMWCWADNGGAEQGKGWPEQVEDVDTTYHWLQRKAHDVQHPEGRMFLLMTWPEYEDCPWNDLEADKHIVFRNDVYCVLGFESYAEMRAVLMGE